MHLLSSLFSNDHPNEAMMKACGCGSGRAYGSAPVRLFGRGPTWCNKTGRRKRAV